MGDLQAVLFDMDGTLVDTETLWWEASAAVGDSLGVSPDPGDVVGRPVAHTASHLVRLAPSAKGDQLDIERRLIQEFADRLAEGIPVLPGVKDLLDELAGHGIPMALVTASPRSIAELVLDAVGRDRFRITIADEDTRLSKPDPAPYLEAMRRLNVTAGHCVVVEDSPVGAAAGRAAGCVVLAVSPLISGVPSVSGLHQVNLSHLRTLVRS